MARIQGGYQKSNKPEEYSIYVYRFPDDVETGHTDWEKKRTTRNKYRALRMARKYQESTDYQRVEVKRKAFSSKYSCHIDKTYKVLECERKALSVKHMVVFSAGGLLLGCAIVGLALYLL